MRPPLRITGTGPKLVCVLVLVLVPNSFWLGLPGETLAPLLHQVGVVVLQTVFTVGVFVLCRIFRGRDEPPAAPRPWWRMTWRAWSSWVFASLWAASLLLGAWGAGAHGVDLGTAAQFLSTAVLAFFFGLSAVQLSGRRVESVGSDAAAAPEATQSPDAVAEAAGMSSSAGLPPSAETPSSAELPPYEATAADEDVVARALTLRAVLVGSVVAGVLAAGGALGFVTIGLQTHLDQTAQAGAVRYDPSTHVFTSEDYYFSAKFPNEPVASERTTSADRTMHVFSDREPSAEYEVTAEQLPSEVPLADRVAVYRRIVKAMPAQDARITVDASRIRDVDGYPAVVLDESVLGRPAKLLLMYCANHLYEAVVTGDGLGSDFLDTFHLRPPAGKTCG